MNSLFSILKKSIIRKTWYRLTIVSPLYNVKKTKSSFYSLFGHHIYLQFSFWPWLLCNMSWYFQPCQLKHQFFSELDLTITGNGTKILQVLCYSNHMWYFWKKHLLLRSFYTAKSGQSKKWFNWQSILFINTDRSNENGTPTNK